MGARGWELTAYYTACRLPSWELSACFDSFHCVIPVRICHQEKEREEGSEEKRGGGEGNGSRESKRDAGGELKIGRDKKKKEVKKNEEHPLLVTH